jgi:hypothetical protein
MTKKIQLIIALSLVLLLILSGCSTGKPTGGSKDKDISQTFMDRVSDKIEVLELMETDDEFFGEFFENTYGLSLDDIEDYAIMEPTMGMSAWAIAMFKMKDSSKTQDGLAAAKARGDKIAETFKDYMPAQYEIAKNYIAIEKNGYILLAVGADAEKVEAIFVELTK